MPDSVCFTIVRQVTPFAIHTQFSDVSIRFVAPLLLEFLSELLQTTYFLAPYPPPSIARVFYELLRYQLYPVPVNTIWFSTDARILTFFLINAQASLPYVTTGLTVGLCRSTPNFALLDSSLELYHHTTYPRLLSGVMLLSVHQCHCRRVSR